jgi:peroxiredoxin
LVQLEEERERFAELGVEVAGMTYDSLEVIAGFHASEGLGYPLLRDVEARHVIAFGVLNEDYAQGHRAYGVPHPGVLFVDRDGTVRAKFAIPGFRDRPPFDELHKNIAEMLR